MADSSTPQECFACSGAARIDYEDGSWACANPDCRRCALRIYNASDYGVMDPTGVVDASPAIQAAIDAAAASGSANCGVQLPPGNATFRCDSPVGLRRGVIVFGDLGG